MEYTGIFRNPFISDCETPAGRIYISETLNLPWEIVNQLLGLFKLLFPYLFSKLGIERVCKEEGNVKKGRKKPDMIFLYRVLKIFFEKYHYKK